MNRCRRQKGNEPPQSIGTNKQMHRRSEQRRARGLSNATDAQAGVVGTLLAISIFAIILSMVINDYIPRWQEDKEAEHAHRLENQIAEFKSSLDRQILHARLEQNRSMTMYHPFMMGLKGVAVFATDSGGDLRINELQNQFILSNGSGTLATSSGSIEFTADHQYYVDQRYIYENGAVIVAQREENFVRMGPQFSLYKENGVVSCAFTMVSVTSDSQLQTSSGTLGLRTQIVTYQQQTFRWPTLVTLQMTIDTQFPTAWAQFYNRTLPSMNIEDADFDVTASDGSVTLSIYRVGDLDLGYASVRTQIERGGS